MMKSKRTYTELNSGKDNIGIESFINNHNSRELDNNIGLKMEVSSGMITGLVGYPTFCNESTSDVYSTVIIMDAFNLVYLAKNITQNIDHLKVNIDSTDVEHFIKYLCKNDTVFPMDIKTKNYLNIMAASETVGKEYNCQISPMNLRECQTPLNY
ncbi:uncharacterized protein LOC135924746 [Gordionus sp. m RMFG-2023]|uniref:uncharacterized protein LOC135924746 n=1 Tax=Gordionus sp. m RMFG-2023 TaxID=3053472 RepID=UPI0031FD73DA